MPSTGFPSRKPSTIPWKRVGTTMSAAAIADTRSSNESICRSTIRRSKPAGLVRFRTDRIARGSADLGDQLLGGDVAIRAIARGGERPSEEAPAQPRGDRSGADAQVDDLGPGGSPEQRPLEKRVREGPRPPDVVGQLL